jgi:hypothetical protein
MFTYSPEKFASLYTSELGQRIWAFVTRPEIVARLETASELGKPAVEGIEEQLLAEFREEILADRVKQMVGHMVRQILEQRDWVLDQTDVKLQSVPFSKAARYRRPDWFTFHAFRNSSDPRDVVITDRRQNPILPSGARWTFYATTSSSFASRCIRTASTVFASSACCAGHDTSRRWHSCCRALALTRRRNKCPEYFHATEHRSTR